MSRRNAVLANDPYGRDPRFVGEDRVHVEVRKRRAFRVNERITLMAGEQAMIPRSVAEKSKHIFDMIGDDAQVDEVESAAPARGARTRAVEGGGRRRRASHEDVGSNADRPDAPRRRRRRPARG